MNYKINRSINIPQTTIKKNFKLKGISIISGKKCEAIFLPANSNQGIIFKIKNKIIAVNNKNYESESFHTTNLFFEGIKIKSVEHLLGAIWGMGVDNIIIEISEDGIPFFDFSAKYYAEAIKNAGVKRLNDFREYFVIQKKFKIHFPSDNRYAEFYPLKTNKFIIESIIDFPYPLGHHISKFTFDENNFLKEISWARSFIRTPLDDDGLKWDRIRDIYPVLPKDPKKSPLITYNKKGYITPVKNESEPSRHKIIDFLGDISFLQKRIIGKVILFKPGHILTHKIVNVFLNKKTAPIL